MFNISMYGPEVTTLQDMSSSLTMEGWACIHSATRPFPS